MASLIDAYDVALAGVKRDRNFMLRLRDRELTPEVSAAFVALIAAHARGVILPGYQRDWRPAVIASPVWAQAFDASLIEVEDGFGLPPRDAVRSELADFWRNGEFQGDTPGRGGLRPWYRPALPVIELALQTLDQLPFAAHALPDIGFSADLRRRKQRFFSASVRFVDAQILRGSGSVYFLYQDPAWLFVLGREDVLECTLSALRKQFVGE